MKEHVPLEPIMIYWTLLIWSITQVRIVTVLYSFLINSTAENLVSQKYDILKGIKLFIALSEIYLYSSLVFNQKLHVVFLTDSWDNKIGATDVNLKGVTNRKNIHNVPKNWSNDTFLINFQTKVYYLGQLVYEVRY